MSPIAKKIAAVAAVCAIAALSAQAESPIAAENGIRLSEWGNSPVLPEVESSAPARKAEGESVLPELGEFLSEEWQTLGAGATDTDRLRKALANRATGRADDSLMSFMTSRWESAPGRLANFLTDHAETRLNAMPGIENAALDLTPAADGNGFGFSASGVGVLHSSESAAFGIQPKIERASEDGILRGSFGAFQRKAVGGAVVGVNAFADFTSHPVRGEASRWRFGADFASPWVDANVQKYVGGLGERYYHGGELHQAYTPHGTAAEIRVHSPDLRWLEGFARFSETEGRGGNADTRTHGFGLAFQPHFAGLSGWQANAELAGGTNDLNVALNYAWTLGKGAALPSLSEPFGVYTKLLNPSFDIERASVESYSLYETAALWEMQHGSMDALSPLTDAELERRMSVAWKRVPEHLRISESLRGKCPIANFAIVDGIAAREDDDWWGFASRHGFNSDEVKSDEASNLMLQAWFGDGGCAEYFQSYLDVNWQIGSSAIYSANEVGARALHSVFRFGGGKFPFLDYDSPWGEGWRFETRNGVPLAFFDGYHNAVKLLLLWGADADAVIASGRNAGQTPLDRLQAAHGEWYTKNFWGYIYEAWDHFDDDSVRFIDFYSAWNSAARETLTKRKANLLAMAQLLKLYGGECKVQPASQGYCSVSPPSHWEKLELQRPEPGTLNEINPPNVAFGHVGEIARIQSNTDYADVDFELESDYDHFSIASAGSATDMSFDGKDTLCVYYHGSICSATTSGRYNPDEESKVGVLRMTEENVSQGRYVITVRAKFHYHIHALNTVTVEVIVNVVGNNAQMVRKFDMGTRKALESVEELVGYRGENLDAVSIPGLEYSTPTAVGSSIGDDGLLQLGNVIYSHGSFTDVFVEATSPNLVGVLTLDIRMQATCPGTAPAAGDTRGLTDLVEAGDYEAFCWRIANRDSRHTDGEYVSSIFPSDSRATSDPKFMWAAMGRNRNRTTQISGRHDNFHPIHYAVLGGDNYLPLFKRLRISHPDQLNATTGRERRNLLMLAAANSESDILDFILLNFQSWNIGIDNKDRKGQTALHRSVYSHGDENARKLLAKGANINAKDGDNRTPIIEAIVNDELPAFRHLLVNNAQVFLLDDFGLGPIHYAIEAEKPEIACQIYEMSNGVIDHRSGPNVHFRYNRYPPNAKARDAVNELALSSMRTLFTHTATFCAGYSLQGI